MLRKYWRLQEWHLQPPYSGGPELHFVKAREMMPFAVPGGSRVKHLLKPLAE